MDKGKKIIIKQNGKVTNFIEKKGKNTPPSNQEYAATLHESIDESHSTYERKTDLASVKSSKDRPEGKKVKPVFITISSAVLIGVFLSILMFQIFVKVENGFISQPGVLQGNEAHVNKQEETPKGPSSTYSAEPLKVHILQAGVFSESDNAETWAAGLKEAHLPNVIWRRDNQFYLMLGLAPTKEAANAVMNQINTGEYDIFVKEWTTNTLQLGLTESEQEWLQLFRTSWESSVQSIAESNNADLASFDSLKEKQIESETLSPLIEIVNSLEVTNETQAQQVLLDLMYEYEQLEKRGNE
ncbi:SPOR domain-containing protein [Oceanobacillus piezotolerans]|uniref:SPOR domain-containing protein n=1 Tax=Oceanobacillus piezotolerans TaxID=2448030 RepID=A0A498DFI4_9BACI|nr:SPOR domain-containing protein [Oceanobacillus piezotolerans]RLL47958.1 SPOR domain-containing protein [Oceanobacillus piezotolerans]